MTDTQETINCPACGCEMTKIFIAEKGLNIDICANGCGGMYFDNKEIQEFNNPNDDLSEIKKILENKNFMPVNQNEKRICPICSTPMVKTYALGIQIDTCYKCGGIFLDNGEFEQIRTHFKKRQKVQQIKPNISDINIRSFYKEAQLEEYYGNSRPRKLDLLSILIDLIF